MAGMRTSPHCIALYPRCSEMPTQMWIRGCPLEQVGWRLSFSSQLWSGSIAGHKYWLFRLAIVPRLKPPFCMSSLVPIFRLVPRQEVKF